MTYFYGPQRGVNHVLLFTQTKVWLFQSQLSRDTASIRQPQPLSRICGYRSSKRGYSDTGINSEEDHISYNEEWMVYPPKKKNDTIWYKSAMKKT